MDTQHEGAHGREAEAGGTPGWGRLIRGFLAAHVAGAAQRVLERRQAAAEAGRLGGSVTAASRAAAAPRPHPQARPVREAEAPAAPHEPVPTRAWGIAKLTFQEFGRDNGTLMAASVAFYLLLSVIPMILLGVAVVASLIQDPDRAINQTFTFLNQFLPIGKQTIRPIIEGVIREKSSLTIVGLAGIALTATGGFATLENAINALWNRPNRGFLMNKVYAFGMMLAVGLLFALSLGLTSMVALASRTSALAWLNVGAWKPVLGIVTPLLISTVMFAVIYRFYPNGRTGWRSSLISGAITAVLWELFKQGYGIYASRDHSPYGIIIGLVMWIYYSSTLILLGSELTWILEGCPDREGKEAVHAQRGRASQPGEA